jgi:hypothetical protein
MQNLCFGHECTILVYRCCEKGFTANACILLPQWTQSDAWLSLGAIRKLWHVKRCKTRVSHFNAIFWCSEVAKNSFAPNASILLHWTENDVWLSFRTFRKPLARKKMQNLLFGHECNILVYRSCKNGYAPNAYILRHWTENDI